MLSSLKLKEIVSQARPIIERQLDDAQQIAAFRDVVSAEGGDWSALKALIKAQVQDERDEAGDGARVRKLLSKAEFATAYADMLGLANMNEGKFSDEDDYDAETGEIPSEEINLNVNAIGALSVQTSAKEIIEPLPPPAAQEGSGAGAAGGFSSSGRTEPSADGQTNSPETAIGLAGPACVPDAGTANTKPAHIQPETANEMDRADREASAWLIEAAENARKAAPAEPEDGSVSHAGAGESPAAISTAAAETAKPAGERDGSPAAPRRRVLFSDPPHKDCLRPDFCGGFSQLGVCQKCKDAKDARISA